MKKFLTILAAAAMAAISCTQEGTYVPAASDAPKYITLSYDNSLSSNTANRAKVYELNGEYIKLSILDRSSKDYIISAGAVLKADASDEQLLPAQILCITGADSVSTISALKDSIATVVLAGDPEEVAFKADESLVPGAGYVVRYLPEEGDPIYIGVVVPEIKVVDTDVKEEVPATTPFGKPTYKTVTYSAATATVFFRQFDSKGKWL